MDDPTSQTSPSKPDLVSALIDADVEEYLDEDARLARFERDAVTAQGFKAMMLAPSLEVCRALLRGERLPAIHLDFRQAERYKLRDNHWRADGRYRLDDFNDRRL